MHNRTMGLQDRDYYQDHLRRVERGDFDAGQDVNLTRSSFYYLRRGVQKKPKDWGWWIAALVWVLIAIVVAAMWRYRR